MSAKKFITPEKIEQISIDKIKPYENNARNNADAVSGVAASIKKFGFRTPILIDKDSVIIEGHTRRLAAISLGMKTVPCIRATDLTPKQVKALRLVDNKVSELSTWDYDKLDAELEAIANMDGDALDLGDMGFPSLDDDFDDGEDGASASGETAPGVAVAASNGGAVVQGVAGTLPPELAGVKVSPDEQPAVDVVAPTAMERVIIVFKPEQKGAVANILGFTPEKIVYDFDEVVALLNGGGAADAKKKC